ncbi:hypothetical protein BJX61DRAFT_237849 [Aspergillus egyptiacus]|nr:hypothetical protein BJX61DRAFT_237849 [Aspergillus egyptiacus]
MELLTEVSEYAVEDDYRLSLIIARFENEYDRVHARTTQLLDAERHRVQCMQHLLLRIENDNLQSQLNQFNHELAQAREGESNALSQLDGTIRDIERLEGVIQASSREIENLRRKLASLNAVASDSQQLQLEKVRLAKEVSTIQTEVEKLRSQTASANALLAENQALNRQLNALEIQLENEKRAHERTLVKGSQQTEQIAVLSSKLEQTWRELELTRRLAQENIQQKGRAPVAHQSPLTGKTEGENRKMLDSREGHQEETPLSHKQQQTEATVTTKVPTERPLGTHPQKLTNRLHSELTIATPGAVRAKDQQNRVTALPGDKSAFSITPFLNRTGGIEESLTSDDELSELRSVSDEKYTKAKQSAVKKIENPGSINEATSNGDTRNRQKQKILNSPDEVGSYNKVPLSRPIGSKQSQLKKRKLGLQRDRSLFDEDEEDDGFQDVRRPGRKLAGTAQASLGGNRVFAGPAGFSPLKRDRKRF